MSENQVEVTGEDFKAWVEKYLELDGEVTPNEFWGARCGLVHSYGIESRQTRKRHARSVGYGLGFGTPAVRANPALSTELVIVDAEALVAAFMVGVDRWVVDEFGDPLRRPLAETRLRKCVHELFQGPLLDNSAS